MANQNKYLTKHVSFSGRKITLYSLDGETWSSRAEELEEIKARHEQERANFGGQIKGGPQARIPTSRPKPNSVKAQYAAALKESQVTAAVGRTAKHPAAGSERAPEPPKIGSKPQAGNAPGKGQLSDAGTQTLRKITQKAVLPRPQKKDRASVRSPKETVAPKTRSGSRPAAAPSKRKKAAGR